MTIRGHEAVTASDGMEALKALQTEGDGIEVIVLDRNMPNMDGFEFMKHLKEETEYGDVPVIFQTARGAPEDCLTSAPMGQIEVFA